MRAMKNTKTRVAALCALAFSLPVAAQHEHQPLPPAATELHPGLGDYHFPITTASPEAQAYFDNGIRLLYGFNHDEEQREADGDSKRPRRNAVGVGVGVRVLAHDIQCTAGQT